MNRIQQIAATAVAVGATIYSVRESIRIHREEEQKRREIERNKNLDIAAIMRASEAIKDRIDNGQIRSIDALAADMRNEIAFQKIAIREDI